MPDYIEEILKDTNVIAPVWDDNVWGALQNKRFDEAGAYFKEVLSGMSAEEWGYVYWMGIVNGIPAFRGEALDATTWKNKALPKIGEAVINAATPIKMSAAYASIGEDGLSSFHNFLISAMPEATTEKRVSWIKDNQPSILGFFLSNPLGLHLSSASDFLNDKNISRLKTIPENLKSQMFSAQTSEIIRKIAEQNNVPEMKIPIVADITGLVFLGFLHPEEIGQEIGDKAGLMQPTAKAIADSLNGRLFSPLSATLDKIYAPLPHEEAPMPKIIEEIKRPEPSKEPAARIDISKTFGGADKSPASFGFKFMESINPPKEKIPAASAPTSKPSNAAKNVFSEFDKIRPAVPVPGAKDVVPPPAMIQRETEIKTSGAASAFKIDIPNPNFSEIKKDRIQAGPAFLEFGGSAMSTSPAPRNQNPPMPIADSKPRVVNYGSLRTPIPDTIAKEKQVAADRVVRELTADKPAPQAPDDKQAPKPQAPNLNPTVIPPRAPQPSPAPVPMASFADKAAKEDFPPKPMPAANQENKQVPRPEDPPKK